MQSYVVRVTCEGQTWYSHMDGSRIDNAATAMLFWYHEAVNCTEVMQRVYNAKCEIIPTDRTS